MSAPSPPSSRSATRASRRRGEAGQPSENDAPSPERDESQPCAANEAELALELNALRIQGFDSLETSDSIQNIGSTLRAPGSAGVTQHDQPRVSIEPGDRSEQGAPGDGEPQSPRPFQKWMRSLHRKARQRPPLLGSTTGALPRWFWGPEHEGDKSPGPRSTASRRRQARPFASFRLFEVLVSASPASASWRGPRGTPHSRSVFRTDRSSRASVSGARVSEDSAMIEKTDAIDAAATERALQRRRILEELISTEEGYIGDVRFLMNVYVTILASMPSGYSGLRASINQNLTEVVELHEEILGELHKAVPHSEYTQLDFPSCSASPANQPAVGTAGHRRWASVDAATSERKIRTANLQSITGMLAEPQVVAEVSKVFAKKGSQLLVPRRHQPTDCHQMNRFFIYKEYGAKYEMIKDVASANQAMPQWDSYQKGLEALASMLGSAKDAEERSKTLTIGNLLVKPIQRVCRYPLLFAELLKQTPVSDCPNSHMEVDSVLMRLREATAEINRATDDFLMKATLERTWLLQDRLVFPNKRLDAASKNQVRFFGHIRLCGALHVCWQSPSGVDGQYLICLYRDVLCFASAGKADPIYIIQACISLDRARIEDVDNGRGLQCHTAPFSWKLVFECNNQLYEVIMTACTPKEEMEWRSRLSRPSRDSPEPRDAGLFSSLDLDMKSMGTVFGKPGTIARRVSIHRATTVGAKSPLCQVVLKNTSIVRDTTSNASTASTINRSQSLLTTNARMPVLAPSRSDRARLETMLADVWSREILPFPGMTTRSRSEHLVRTSASTVMRKLSIASLTSTFTWRSGSLTQKSKPSDDVSKGGSSRRRGWKSSADDGGLEYNRGVESETIRGMKRARTGQSMPSCPPGETCDREPAATSGALGRAQTVKRTVEAGEATALRASSANSLRPGQPARSEKAPRPVEKENTSPGADDKTPGQARRGKSGGTSKSDGGSLGFRSLFR